jgi:flagellar biosynthesis/type III secretory pathway chaperone
MCEQHRILFDLTIDEYNELLQSHIENVELIGLKKADVIEHIRLLDEERKVLIHEISNQFSVELKDAHHLLNFFTDTEIEKKHKHLFKFNAFLIDVITALRDQNKKNQIFINKAINAISEIKNVAMGIKPYSTYDSRGNTSHATNK